MLARAKKSRTPNTVAGSTGGSEEPAGAATQTEAVSTVVSKSLVEEVEQALLAAIAGKEDGGVIGAGLQGVGENDQPSEAGDDEGESGTKRIAVKKTLAKSKSGASKKGSKSGAKKSRTRKYESDTDEDEDEEEDMDEEESVQASLAEKRGKGKAELTKPTSSRRGKQIKIDDDDDDY